ncbi:MAG: hypothetical protein JWL88_431 [Parcubacteria group bacterium]|nr:hypothetical protein [Parcubacteria group bacterium]
MTESTLIPKTKEIVFQGGRGDVRYTVHYIAPDESLGENGWSFSKLKEDNLPFLTRVAREFRRCGVYHVDAPAVAFSSAIIGDCNKLTKAIPMPFGVTTYRNQNEPMDGSSVAPGRGWAGSFAGCGFVAAEGDGELLGVHVSRDGLTATPNVIDSIARHFLRKGIPLNRVMLRFLFYIDPEIFTHSLNHPDPVWAKKNSLLKARLDEEYGPDIMVGDEGKLYLDRFVMAIARPYGFKEVGCSRKIASGSGFVTTREPGFEKSRNLLLLVRKN